MDAARHNHSPREGTTLPTVRAVRLIPNEVEDSFRALERLKAEDINLLKAIQDYRSAGAFSPRDAVLVYGAMRADHLYKPSLLLKVSLRSEQHKKQIRKITLKNLAMIWPLLSAPQRRVIQAMGREPDAYL